MNKQQKIILSSKLIELIISQPLMKNNFSLDKTAWNNNATSHNTKNNPKLCVISIPKSGSTFLTNFLSSTINVPIRRLCYAYSSNEHDLYLPAVVLAESTGCASQLHMRATPHNLEIINKASICPIICTRNIYDNIASMSRDLQKKSRLSNIGTGLNGYSFVWLCKDMKNWDQSDFIDYAIDFYLPWYINFLLSWAPHRNNKSFYFVRYEEIQVDKVKSAEKILSFLDYDQTFDKSILDVDYLSNNPSISSTKSSIGSGIDCLEGRQIDKIHQLLNLFDNDFILSHKNIDI